MRIKKELLEKAIEIQKITVEAFENPGISAPEMERVLLECLLELKEYRDKEKKEIVRKEEIQHIVEHYGYDSQSRQCIEEMSELTQAINKYWRYELQRGRVAFTDIPLSTPSVEKVIEEIADVEFCLAQLKHLLQCNDEVQQIYRAKVDRELDRVAEETRK